MNPIFVAFVPVIHKGYVDLFKKYPDHIVLLGSDSIAEYTSLTRDTRVVEPKELSAAIMGFGFVKRCTVADKKILAALGEECATKKIDIVMPEDEISRDVAEKYFKQCRVIYESVFLRWNKTITLAEHVVPAHRTITRDAFHKEMMAGAFKEAAKSSDWWRQIATVVVKEGKVIFSEHNHPLPNDYVFATFGDPRSNFDAGQHQDIFLTIHSEAAAVAHAAHDGVSLEGATLYVTTFPCPNCARLLCKAGVKKVFYSKGYSLLDAEKILNHFGVEVVLVQG